MDGTAAVANGSGVIFEAGSTGNTIGGLTTTPGTGAGNLVSGNTSAGVYVLDSGGNLVEGNLIGTDLTGSTALANVDDGIVLQQSSNDTIGGTAAVARNVISGNDAVNVELYYSSDETVEGNLIGTNATGEAAISNGVDGIVLNGGADNSVGGTAAGAGNVISGNADYGVLVFGAVRLTISFWGT